MHDCLTVDEFLGVLEDADGQDVYATLVDATGRQHASLQGPLRLERRESMFAPGTSTGEILQVIRVGPDRIVFWNDATISWIDRHTGFLAIAQSSVTWGLSGLL